MMRDPWSNPDSYKDTEFQHFFDIIEPRKRSYRGAVLIVSAAVVVLLGMYLVL